MRRWIVFRRQGRVVWTIGVHTDPAARDFGLSRAEALAEFVTYAAKLGRRVGRG